MKELKSFFLLIIIILALPAYSQEPVEVERSEVIQEIKRQKYYIHEVEKGQTLYSISKVYNVTIKELIFENPEAENSLAIGQQLKIPVVSRDEKVVESLGNKDYDFFYHVAAKGETFSDIGEIYDIQAENIRLVNQDLVEPLRAGQYVKVPVSFYSNVRIFKNEDKENEIPDKQETKQSPEGNHINHIVKKQETLYRISKMYNVTIDDIVAINPGLTPNIKIGQIIKIPRKSDSPVKEEQIITPSGLPIYEHEVKSGENLYRVALNFKVSIDTLKKYNPGLSEKLSVGQIIKIPIDTTKKDYINHRVDKKKDKLKKIAKKYGLETSELRDMNPLLGNRVYKGQIVRIPVDTEEEVFAELDTLFVEPDQKLFQPEIDSSSIFKDLQKNLKKTYNVALMLPLYLREVDSIKLDDFQQEEQILMQQPFRFIQFYEGLLMAADTLRHQGLKLNLHVYDVDQNVSTAIEALQDPRLKNMDLIIGPLFSKSFELASNFSKLFDVKIINPLTFRNEIVEGNNNVFKIQPSFESQVEQVAEFILDRFPYSKIIIVRDNKYKSEEVVDRFRKILNDSIIRNIPVPNYLLHNILVERSRNELEDEDQLLASIQVEERMIFQDDFSDLLNDTTMFRNYISEVVYMQDSIQGILNNASVVRDNVIIAISDDRVFILDFLTKLNVMRDTFNLNVIGIPNWEAYTDFAPELFQNINLHLFTPGFINYKKPDVEIFVNNYRTTYHTEPGTLAFEGYDIGYYFLNALMNFGDRFEHFLDYYNPDLLQTRYYFDRNSFDKGYENKFWNIYKFENYQLQQIPNIWFNRIRYQHN